MTSRIAFNLVALVALGLIVNPHPVEPGSVTNPPTAPALPPLTVELRNAHALPGKTSAIAVDFVMKNNTDRLMTLVERWNSWGAHQWEYQITDARGKRFILVNPQGSWYANMLTFFSIVPGSEFKMSCFVDYIQIDSHAGKNNFVERERLISFGEFVMGKDGRMRLLPPRQEGGWKYPVTVVGKFTAEIVECPYPFAQEIKRSNWSGTITTAPVTVNAPEAP